MIRELILVLTTMALVLNGLRARIERISQEARGRVGAAVLLLETNDSTEFRGDERFPMQSVYKLAIGMAVLNKVEAGALELDRKIRVERGDLVPSNAHSPIRDAHPAGGVEFTLRELLRYMISESDGTASDVLLKLVGGPEQVMTFLHSLGLNRIIVANYERELAADEQVQYRNWATPNEMVKLLRMLYEGRALRPDARALLLQFMTESNTGPRRIKGLLPAATPVAHKTGTSNTVDGMTRATNDAGIITLPDGRHLIVAVFISDSTANQATREGVIAKIARAAWDWSVGSQRRAQ